MQRGNMSRYCVKKFSLGDRDVWTVHERQSGRVVATYFNEGPALSLTHTLNVATLSSSIIEFRVKS